MRIRLLLFSLLLFFLFEQKAHADTFIVSSNADSGPGTLREAITLAADNGTVVVDSIIFHLPDLSRDGRTIVILSELPPLSSNLVIDGSTQDGPSFGKSQAKVILLINAYQAAPFTILTIANSNDIGIYGLYLFNSKFTVFGGGPAVDGIQFTHCNNITVGKAGKGNYFRGLYRAIYSPSSLAEASDHLTIQSNIFNNDEEGNMSILNPPGYIDPMEYAINVYNTSNILIGGSNNNEGNVSNARNIFIRSGKASGNGYLTITNNYFSIGASGIINYDSTGPRLQISVGSTDFSGAADYSTTIRNNILHGHILLRNLTKLFTIQSNTIFDNYTVYPQGDFRIYIEMCTGGGMIGGDNPGEGNLIYSTRSSFGNYNFQLDQGSIFTNSPGISIFKNVMYCNDYYYSSIFGLNSSLPYVRIDSNTVNYVSGKATPNCRIDVFIDDECSACEGRTYLGQTQSGPDSSWVFIGSFNGTTVATATNSAGSTSEYSQPFVNINNVVLTQPVCGQLNGSITGVQLGGTWDNVEWHMHFLRDGYYIDTLISTELNLTDVGPGNYYFVSRFEQTCKSTMYFFTLKDYSPKVDTTNLDVQHPSCGLFNGRISGLRITAGEFSSHYWVDQSGQTYNGNFSAGIASIDNLPPGQYRLIVIDNTVGCADTTRLYVLTNQDGPSLNTTNMQITSATCNNSNGSITNITSVNVMGTPFIQWVDSLNNIVGNTLDLLNQPAGRYKLKFKDQGTCGTIITPYLLIPNEGKITIDESNIEIKSAGCTINNGSISNIKISGETTLHWENLTTNTNAGNTADIFSLAPGDYQLTASNSFGCIVSSSIITIPQSQFISIIPQQAIIENGSCGGNNGSIQLQGFSNEAALFSYHWINSGTTQVIGTALTITDLGAGTYEFVAVDTNGCEQIIFTQPIIVNPKPSFNPAGMIVNDDECSLQKGSITGIEINDLQGPTTYTWTNTNNLVVGNSQNLSNIGSGEYRLMVNDNGDCIIESGIVLVNNEDNAGISPIYDDVTIPKNTETSLIVKNHRQGTYILYNDAAGTQIHHQNHTGIFTTGILNSDHDFYIRHVSGSCSSSLINVKVTVVDKSVFAIPSAFTPNNDGLNDKLTLKVIGHIEVEYFRVYNRNGELVFSTKTINNGWDGSLKGMEQPSGAYVWVARGKDITGKSITGKGSFVLIR